MAEEAPSGEQVPVTHIVVTVHAIRTYGEWQGRLEELVAERLRDSPPTARPLFCHYRYGFFSLLAFYFAPTRWLQVRRFRTDLERLIGRYPAVERIDIFAHSFRDILASWALERQTTLPRRCRALPISCSPEAFCGELIPGSIGSTGASHASSMSAATSTTSCC